MKHFLLIDGSYFIFYRVFALLIWWKNAKPDIPLEEPFKNAEFVDKFRTTFSTKIQDIIKKLKIKNIHKIIIGKDCTQSSIWRMNLFDTYKSGRDETKNKQSNIAEFFKMTYDEDLFINAGADYIFKYNSLEADDCIALTTKYLLNKYNQDELLITIITSDHDYLQLVCDNVMIYNLKYKLLTDSKTCMKDPKKDLFFKIIGGDKSDNIKAVFKKCGPKTLEKCYSDTEFFNNKLNKEENALSLYELNKVLIDFNNIPTELVEGFQADVLDKIEL
tara:strand:- start:538 stop:1362 length:825 start_codon:yes stop_codon:yes gene_type:complete